jgi:ABC-type glutathione transport system ATPase component
VSLITVRRACPDLEQDGLLVRRQGPGTRLRLAGQRQLLETVFEGVRNPARSVIFSSHSLADVERIADRLLVVAGARSRERGRRGCSRACARAWSRPLAGSPPASGSWRPA